MEGYREGGVPSTWQGVWPNRYGRTVTGLVTQHYAASTERLKQNDGQRNVSEGTFVFLTGLDAVISHPSTRLLSLPPPALGSNGVLRCHSVPKTLVSFSSTKQRFKYCSAASLTRLNHLPHVFAASVHCLRSVDKFNNDRSQTTQSCSCSPSYAFPPSSSPRLPRWGGLLLPV